MARGLWCLCKGHFSHETESPWRLHFKHTHWKRWSRSKWSVTLHLGDQRTTWMPDGRRVYMDSYMASNGSCFMVTWTAFKNHFLEEVGLTQNQETMAFWTLTTVGLLYFYHVWGPAWIEIHWNSIWLMARSHMTSHYTWGSVTTWHDFWRCCRTAFGHFLMFIFWACDKLVQSHCTTWCNFGVNS